MTAGRLRIESGRDVEQHMVVAERLRFPKHAAAEIDVAADAFFEPAVRNGRSEPGTLP